MLTLEDLIAEWETDSKIDEMNLDKTTIQCAVMHAKYLERFSLAKLQLKRKKAQLNELMKDKWMYFNGKMTKQDMDDRGWKYDPFNGMSKPLKGDMDLFYESDPDVVKLKAQISYQETMVEALEEIMNTIRWRHNVVKNIIEWKRFQAGM